MKSLAEYPDLMTAQEVAQLLRLSLNTVYSLQGLRKMRLGNGGRGIIRFKKEDVLLFLNKSMEDQGESCNAGDKKERYRKMGVPSLLSWKELQAARLGHERTGS